MNEYKERIEKKIKKRKLVCFFDTQVNSQIWDTFLEYCKNESDDNYLQGIKKLLQAYSTDWKYNALFNEIQLIKEQIHKQTKVKIEDKKPSRKIKTFGE